jgi:tetratricopeptide (TPR) repeat protein
VWLYLKSSKKPAKPQPDMVAVLEANNIGVGHIEQYEYGKAAQAFEKVVDMAPDWTPGRINLGIALLNQQGNAEAAAKEKGEEIHYEGKSNIDRAVEIFDKIIEESEVNEELKKNKYHLYAHFCLGMIWNYKGNLDQALTHFETVAKGDPNDAATQARYGTCLTNLSEFQAALPPLEKAVQLDPYSLMALQNLRLTLRHLDRDADREVALLEVEGKLNRAGTGLPTDIKYGKMGHYAEVIGSFPASSTIPTGPIPLFLRNDKLRIKLAHNARWATAKDFGHGPVADLRRAARERFGGCMVSLDYNQDGKPDLFLVGAVVENDRIRDQ